MDCFHDNDFRRSGPATFTSTYKYLPDGASRLFCCNFNVEFDQIKNRIYVLTPNFPVHSCSCISLTKCSWHMACLIVDKLRQHDHNAYIRLSRFESNFDSFDFHKTDDHPLVDFFSCLAMSRVDYICGFIRLSPDYHNPSSGEIFNRTFLNYSFLDTYGMHFDHANEKLAAEGVDDRFHFLLGPFRYFYSSGKFYRASRPFDTSLTPIVCHPMEYNRPGLGFYNRFLSNQICTISPVQLVDLFEALSSNLQTNIARLVLSILSPDVKRAK
jgi:hypothetical protein